MERSRDRGREFGYASHIEQQRVSMTRVLVVSLALGALTAAWSGTTFPISVMFQGNSALADLSPADLDALEAAARRALNEAPDGEPVIWTNPETASTGSVTPLHAEREDAGVCRDLDIAEKTPDLRVGRSRGQKNVFGCLNFGRLNQAILNNGSSRSGVGSFRVSICL